MAWPDPPPARPHGTLVGGLPWDEPGVAAPVGPAFAPPPDIPPVPALHDTFAQALRERGDEWLRKSPPFTASLSLHVLVMLVLALVMIREEKPRRLTLDMSFASDTAGDDAGGTVTIGPESEPTEPAPAAEPVAANPPTSPPPEQPPFPTPPDDEPIAAEMPTVPTVVPLTQPTDAPAAGGGPTPPDVTRGLAGRAGGRKEALLAGTGGSAETEAAVARALEWLVRKQGRDGLWSLQGPYPDGSNQENRLAATAMALIALQGAGHTHRDGRYQEQVGRGWRALLKAQTDEGVFELGRMPDQHAMYAHAQATIAVCELLGMTGDDAIRPAAQRALDYCLAAQMPDGGWRYRPPQPGGENKGDMSVTGWFMMALKSGEMAGLAVPPETYARLGQFLDAVFISDAKGYGYQILPNQKVVQVRPALTAEALLCRQYMGWRRDDPRLLAGLDLLFRELPLEFGYPHKNVYAWYYTTQVCHHTGGNAWRRWNDQMSRVLPASQVATGKEAGSWDPAHDQWGHFGGRLFMTCLCTCMLEVYYRHLPLYGGADVPEPVAGPESR
jgi:hypothetical protein